MQTIWTLSPVMHWPAYLQWGWSRQHSGSLLQSRRSRHRIQTTAGHLQWRCPLLNPCGKQKSVNNQSHATAEAEIRRWKFKPTCVLTNQVATVRHGSGIWCGPSQSVYQATLPHIAGHHGWRSALQDCDEMWPSTACRIRNDLESLQLAHTKISL